MINLIKKLFKKEEIERKDSITESFSAIVEKTDVPKNVDEDLWKVKPELFVTESKRSTIIRTTEPAYIKINVKMDRNNLPKEENLEFVNFSGIDGFPIFKYWGDCGYLANLYPIEELIRTTNNIVIY